MILVELRTSLLPNDDATVSVNRGTERFNQVELGMNSFMDQINVVENIPEIDIYFSDNTIGDEVSIPENIRTIIKNNSIKPMYQIRNEYGRRNKGAGLIEMWRGNVDTISKYEWVLYFEPRTIIKDSEFIRKCLHNPGNHFKVINDGSSPHFYTGIFMIKTDTLIKFCENSDLDQMINSSISIESYLKDFMDSNNHEYTEYSNKLNIIWHDVTQNRFIEF